MATPSLPSLDAPAQACAACKYQGQQCSPGCVLARYFPADEPAKFEAAHDLFGVAKILQTIEGLDETQADTAMRNIIFQSLMRKKDPAGGCGRIISDLESELQANIAKRDALLAKRDDLLARMQAGRPKRRPPRQPPPVWTARHPAGAYLAPLLPQRDSRVGDRHKLTVDMLHPRHADREKYKDKPTANMVKPTKQNLEELLNAVSTYVDDPPQA